MFIQRGASMRHLSIPRQRVPTNRSRGSLLILDLPVKRNLYPDHGDVGFRESSDEYRQSCAGIGGVGQDDPLYEAAGLIATAHRSGSGYRIYTQADVHVLRFIKRARDLGFSIGRMRRLLDLWQDKSRTSRDVKRLALDHIADIAAKIAEMSTVRDAVSRACRQV